MIAHPSGAPTVRPPVWLYALACLPGVIGVVLAVVLAVGAINNAGSLIDRLVTPPVDLAAGGLTTFSAHHDEGRTIYERVFPAGQALPPDALNIRCTVRAPDGSSPNISGASGVSLDQNGSSYRSLYSFDTPLDGSYELTCRQSGHPAPSTPLAVGPRIRLTSILSTIGHLVAALAALVLGLGIAGGVGALIHQRRQKSRRQMLNEPVDPLTGMRG